MTDRSKKTQDQIISEIRTRIKIEDHGVENVIFEYSFIWISSLIKCLI